MLGHAADGEQPVLRLTVLGVCLWESAALTTNVVPSVSASMWRLPWWQRAILWGLVVLALTDHFFTRRWVR